MSKQVHRPLDSIYGPIYFNTLQLNPDSLLRILFALQFFMWQLFSFRPHTPHHTEIKAVVGFFFFFFFPFLSFFFFFFFFCFFGITLQHVKVPRPGVESELQLLAYATATTATPHSSCICDLHHSSGQC